MAASQVALAVKNLPGNAGDIRDTGLIPGLGRSPGRRRAWQPTPVFLPGKFHGQRSLAGLIHICVYEELTHWKILRCWEGLGAGEEGDDRG